MERIKAAARHSWARHHAWLLLSAFPFPVGHPMSAGCTGQIFIIDNFFLARFLGHAGLRRVEAPPLSQCRRRDLQEQGGGRKLSGLQPPNLPKFKQLKLCYKYCVVFVFLLLRE